MPLGENKIKKAIILAAGKGRRLQQITKDIPKCLIPIAGKAIIDYQIEYFNAIGVEEIVIVLGYRAEQVKQHLSSKKGLKFYYNQDYASTNVLYSLWVARQEMESAFYFLHGDTIFESEIARRLARAEGEIVLCVEKKRCHEEEMKVRLAKNKIVEINKSMTPSTAYGEFIGLAKLSTEVVEKVRFAVENLINNNQKGLFFESALQLLIDEKIKISICGVDNLYWEEIDFFEDLTKAQNNFKR